MKSIENQNIEFINYWKGAYGSILPIDFQLKFDLSHLWFRIHSLPKSKRYPETEVEYQFILDRQQKLLNKLIEREDEIFYLIGYYNYEPEKTTKLQTEIGEFAKALTIDLFETDQEVQFGPYDKGDLYEIYIMRTIWEFETVKTILRKIANDEYDYRFSIFNSTQKRIFIPYDGGMDIIMETEESKAKYHELYSDWCSTRKDGM